MARGTKGKSRGTGYARISYESYDGSAVRRLEQGAAIPQPRPQVKPQRRELARPKIQVREAGSVSAFAAVGFLAVGVFAVLLLFSYVQLHQISEEIVSLRGEMSELQSEENVLRARYEQVYDLAAIEEAMLSTGRMVKPQYGQTIYVDLSEPDSVTFFAQEERAEGAAGAIQSFQSICTEILEYFK